MSVAAAQIVANSKALHHLLPALVPPIDREYTFRFFYDRTMLTINERTVRAFMSPLKPALSPSMAPGASTANQQGRRRSTETAAPGACRS